MTEEMRYKIFIVPAVAVLAAVIIYASTWIDSGEEQSIESIIHNAHDKGLKVIRFAESGEAGRALALDVVEPAYCCDRSLPCVLGEPIAITDAELAGVPRIKALLEVALGEEFSRGGPHYERDDDLNVYEIYSYEDISVSTGVPEGDILQYYSWRSDWGRFPVAEYEGEIFVFASWDRSSMWSSLKGPRC